MPTRKIAYGCGSFLNSNTTGMTGEILFSNITGNNNIAIGQFAPYEEPKRRKKSSQCKGCGAIVHDGKCCYCGRYL